MNWVFHILLYLRYFPIRKVCLIIRSDCENLIFIFWQFWHICIINRLLWFLVCKIYFHRGQGFSYSFFILQIRNRLVVHLWYFVTFIEVLYLLRFSISSIIGSVKLKIGFFCTCTYMIFIRVFKQVHKIVIFLVIIKHILFLGRFKYILQSIISLA